MLLNLIQTPLLKRNGDKLINLLRLKISDIEKDNVIIYKGGDLVFVGEIENEGEIEYWVDEPSSETELNLKVKYKDTEEDFNFTLKKPKHYTLYLNMHSHHDPGYTDILSHVFESHYNHIDTILDEMDKRDDYPEEARLKITIEQFWSLDYYLNKAPKDRVQKVIDRVKKGDIELTAFYGNMITEQLGHEECYRQMYRAEAFAQKCGVKIFSAMHNDIPGISWGVCRALCDANIKFLNGDFPRYYDWGYEGLVSFWDSKKIFGHDGPGVCYWKTQDGRKLMLWNTHASGLSDWNEREIEDKILWLESFNYPYNVYKGSVKISNIDNGCYSASYADGVKNWNETYEFPRLINGSNEDFYYAILKDAEENNTVIPEVSGEMPGQDYPVAAMSMAEITSTALKVQQNAVFMDKLLAIVDDDSVMPEQKKLSEEVWKDLLLSDDHAYGSQFPAGPAMRASYWEKGSLIMRAEATVTDLIDKALSSIVDRIAAKDSNLRLLVFNPSGSEGNFPVKTLMREFDNCGTILNEHNHHKGVLKGYILNNRRRVNPEPLYWQENKFDLIDLESGKIIPYEITDLSWNDPEYYAAEGFGLGSGTRRYGFFENPGGMKKILSFIAEDLPSFGYRCYALKEKDTKNILPEKKIVTSIQNGIYKIDTDEKGITSVIDLRTSKELLDKTCPHRLCDVLARNGSDFEAEIMEVQKVSATEGALSSEIKIEATIDGAHEINIRLKLYNNIDKVEVSLHILKSTKPLQTMFMAFPFVGDGFKYQNVLGEISPVKDSMPGAQSDALTVKDYVHVLGSDILWSSRDSAVTSLGNLWGGYISPAHRCVMKLEEHKPLKEEDFKGGRIYAMLCANNFGTNFMCSQTFNGVYNFSFAVKNEASEAECAAWGEMMQNPVITQFTDRSRGENKATASLIDAGKLHVITLKKAEDNNGYIVRLWNHLETKEEITFNYKGKEIKEFFLTDALERAEESIKITEISPKTILTLRFQA